MTSTKNTNKRASGSSMFHKLGWLTVNQLSFYHTVTLVFKLRSSKEPDYLKNNAFSYNKYNISIAKSSFSLRGAESWNLLPCSSREQPKISTFKKLVKKWILENVDRFLG